MCYRDPVIVIDETIGNLEYLTACFLADIDAGALDRGQLAPRAVKSIAALQAAQALLPRLRIVRSNYEAAPRLPDARDSYELLHLDRLPEFCDACETSAVARHVGGLR